MKNINLYLVMALVSLILIAASSANMLIPANDNAKDNSAAPQHSPVIDENWDLIRVDYIHYAKSTSQAKPSKTETCYKLMGVKWLSLPVSYVINPSNPYNLDEGSVASKISSAAETWDAATEKELFNQYAIDYSAEYGVYDNKNSVVFGSLSDNNIIAVTSVWYTRRGKQIVEFDMLFNNFWVWGDASTNSGVMDLENIATHEMGHTVGLSDIYSLSCTEVTMYGYSSYGETKKTSLEQPDIAGLNAIYGT